MFVSSRASAPLMARRALRICSLAAVLSFGAAHGAETAEVGKAMPTGGHAGNAFIGTWDDDGDGKVTHPEYDAVRKVRFAATDGDNNGALTIEEYVNEYAVRLDRDIADERNASLKQTDTRFKALDKDEDKFVSRAEYDDSGERAFVHLDRNKDGKLDHVEYVNEFSVRLSRQIEDRRQAQLKQGRVRFKAIDTNENGDVSRDEYFAMSARMFERADTNKDGVITPDDPPPVREPRQDERAVTSQVPTP